MSREALVYARRLAARTHRFPDTKRALVGLLERWGAGLTADRVERRMAVRLSQERLRLVGEDDAPTDDVNQLPSRRRLAAMTSSPGGSNAADRSDLQVVEPAEVDLDGDDDEDDECEAASPGDEEVLLEEDEFYAGIMDSR